MSISSERIRKLDEKVKSPVGHFRLDAIRELNDIADRYRFDGERINASGVERDEVISMLAGSGSASFTQYMYGESFRPASRPNIHIPKNYQEALETLGIPLDEVHIISKALKKGKIPFYILQTVNDEWKRVGELHPDYYPWHAVNFDALANGLEDAGLDTRKIWETVEKTMESKLKGVPAICLKNSEGLTNLFEIYALAKYHDLKELKFRKPLAA